MFRIRPEEPADFETMDHLLTVAFAFDAFSQQMEAKIVRRLRETGLLTVSLVAEFEGECVGQIAFSPITISDGTPDWHALGPISVDPRLQRRGIGRKLMKAGLEALQAKGSAGCVVLGEAEFYQQFGFMSMPELRLPGVHPHPFMAQHFSEKIPQGTVAYAAAFSL